MALIKLSDIKKMNSQDKKDKIKELKLELIKSHVTANTNMKTKEIKRAIARLITFNILHKEELNKK
ncbi:MAG: 50S ribosomal protein L29 [Nanoarchaeota archaeon]